MSKGSAPRQNRDDAAYASGWDRIFSKPQEPLYEDQAPTEVAAQIEKLYEPFERRHFQALKSLMEHPNIEAMRPYWREQLG